MTSVSQPHERGKASVPVLHSEGGVVSVQVSPSKEGVAFVCPSERGVALISLSPSQALGEIEYM